MKLISFNLPESDLSSILFLVKLKLYPNKSEFIRKACKLLLSQEYLIKEIENRCKKAIEIKEQELEKHEKEWQRKFDQAEEYWKSALNGEDS